MSDWNSRDLEDWDWAYGLGTPIKCRIVTQPETAFQVFIGLSKAHWNEPGKRLVDIVIQIRHVDTVDTFEAGKNVTFARMFPAKSNAKGESALSSHPTNRRGMEVRLCAAFCYSTVPLLWMWRRSSPTRNLLRELPSIAGRRER